MTTGLSIASFNLHWGRGGRVGFKPFDVVTACRTLDADVLVLQESWAPDGGPAQHEEVAAALGYSSVTAVPLGRAVVSPHLKVVDRPEGTRHRGDGDWCLALLSRRPVARATVHELEPQLHADPAARRLIRAEVDVDGRMLAVHGTHMSHLEFGVHRHGPDLRAALAPAEQAGVLIGDMNMWGWCLRRILPPGWRLVGRGATFPSHLPLARIDHIAVTSSVEVLDAEVVPHLGSDHRAIRARLRLP